MYWNFLCHKTPFSAKSRLSLCERFMRMTDFLLSKPLRKDMLEQVQSPQILFVSLLGF